MCPLADLTPRVALVGWQGSYLPRSPMPPRGSASLPRAQRRARSVDPPPPWQAEELFGKDILTLPPLPHLPLPSPPRPSAEKGAARAMTISSHSEAARVASLADPCSRATSAARRPSRRVPASTLRRAPSATRHHSRRVSSSPRFRCLPTCQRNRSYQTNARAAGVTTAGRCRRGERRTASAAV